MVRVLKADIELFFTRFIRAELLDSALLTKYPVLAGFEVSNVEPPEDASTFPAKLVVVRLVGDADDDLNLSDVDISISVLMGSPSNLADPSLAARVIHAIVRDCARVEAGNPVAAVTESNGPYAVPESQPRARLFSTHRLRTVGESL